MTPVTEILTLLKIFFSPFFIINVCQYFNGQLTFLYVTVVWKSNTVTQFRDENNDKKRRIKVRRWTLKIIFIHTIFTIQYVHHSSNTPTKHLAIDLQHISKKYPILSVFYRSRKRFKYHILAHIYIKNRNNSSKQSSITITIIFAIITGQI